MRVGGLDLALDLEAGEEGYVVLVELQALLGVRRHEPGHVLLGLLEGARIVDQYLTDVVGEVIAHRAGDRVAFTEHQKGCRAVFGGRGDLLPLALQVVQVPLQLLGGAADPGGAHDRAHAVRNLQLAHDLAHLVAVFALDAARHSAGPRIVRHQDEKASRQADERGEGRTLVAALLLLDLDDEVLSFGEQLADVHPPALRLLAEELLGDLLHGQEAVALRAIVDEAGLERGLYAGDAGFVDVGLFLFSGG